MLIALIMLVAMSLAGAAMYRSTNTSLGITGNLAFKQSSVFETDQAVGAAVAWLNTNKDVLTASSAGNGYIAMSPMVEPEWISEAIWDQSKQLANIGTNLNKLEYIIHRMCLEDGPYNSATNQCSMLDTTNTNTSGDSIRSGSTKFSGQPQVIYRVTVRATGTKNSKAIVQVFVAVPV